MKRHLALETLLLLLGSLALTGRAAAQPSVPRQQVTLVDGSQLQGDIVEMVTQDHVTLRDAAGQVRRIAWSDIKSMGPVTPFGTPLPAPLPPAPPVAASVTWPEPDRTVPTPSGVDARPAPASEPAARLRLQPARARRGVDGGGRHRLPVERSPRRGRRLRAVAHWIDFEVGEGYGARSSGRRCARASASTGRSHLRDEARHAHHGGPVDAGELPALEHRERSDAVVRGRSRRRDVAHAVFFVTFLVAEPRDPREFGYGFLLNEGSYHQPCQVGSPCESSDGPGGGILGGPTVLDRQPRHRRDAQLPLRGHLPPDLGGTRRRGPRSPATSRRSWARSRRRRRRATRRAASRRAPESWARGRCRRTGCTSAMRRGFLAAEPFSRSLDEDTEVVVIGGVLDGPELLVRIPHADKMARAPRGLHDPRGRRPSERDAAQQRARRGGIDPRRLRAAGRRQDHGHVVVHVPRIRVCVRSARRAGRAA